MSKNILCLEKACLMFFLCVFLSRIKMPGSPECEWRTQTYMRFLQRQVYMLFTNMLLNNKKMHAFPNKVRKKHTSICMQKHWCSEHSTCPTKCFFFVKEIDVFICAPRVWMEDPNWHEIPTQRCLHVFLQNRVFQTTMTYMFFPK